MLWQSILRVRNNPLCNPFLSLERRTGSGKSKAKRPKIRMIPSKNNMIIWAY
nr:MAG TPA: hypothetical protein [Caudoviricetes sp.]